MPPSPYFARDIAEFWRRWHISLSSWFRDYLYIPLGGSKGTKLISVRNVFIIFLVSGFWHGANWNFVVWGGIHALGFLPLLLADQNRAHLSNVVAENKKLPSLKELQQIVFNFAFVSFAWIFFRSPDLTSAIHYIQKIFNSTIHQPNQFLAMPLGKSVFLYVIPLIIMDWQLRRDERKLKKFG